MNILSTLLFITKIEEYNAIFGQQQIENIHYTLTLIDNDKKENSLVGKIISASFVGNSYQYIISTSVGKIYVISNDTINNFKLDNEVFLSFNKNDIKILDD